MIIAYIAAGFGFAATAIYGYRLGGLLLGYDWPDRIMRLLILALMTFVGVAFLDVAQQQEHLVWRQWPVFLCLVGIAVAGAWPRKS